jgi:phosphate transport system ATP-binding protein
VDSVTNKILPIRDRSAPGSAASIYGNAAFNLAPVYSLKESQMRNQLDIQSETNSTVAAAKTAIATDQLNFFYGVKQVLKNVSIAIPTRNVTAFIGPSGCGKSTLLRCFNRMNDLVDGAHHTGTILIENMDIYGPQVNVTGLRRKVGMVFQKSNPFPKSIFENVAFGLRIQGVTNRSEIESTVVESLKSVALWDEVADRLHESALGLSGGQQQRLCIARAIAVQPSILLMDEPCSALDPIASAKIEQLIYSLGERYTIVIVTHNMQQAARVSDFTSFLLTGEVVEFGKTVDLFQNPTDSRTMDYITGRFG